MSSVITARPATPASTDLVNILIVDDEPKNLMVLETVLDDPGYRLVRASSGDEALLALMAEEFAVLVLDVRMPGMTGFELAQMIRKRRKTARVPIIFLTAYYNEDQHVLEGYGSGGVDYLYKPVNAAVLRSKVAVFAELHRKGRAVEVANRALLAEVAERRRAEARLSELNETLDRRVTERTTALHASEAQLRDANRRKDEFLATLAHELRNPLAPVRNAVQLLRLKGASSEVRWASALIDRQVQAMSRLIDDLMDVSRINQGKIELRRERIDLAAVLQDAVETTRPLTDELEHELTLVLPETSLPLDADRSRLAQAFMNLLNNAAKYMDRGGRIEVAVRRQDNQAVEVTVTDNGIGIAADRVGGLFEMFSQVESALSRSRGGLGIGLSLTRRLVEMHGGSVEARSGGLGHGSAFVVRLPLAPELSEEQPVVERSHSHVASGPVDGGLRILVADDNQDAADTLAALLEVMGHSVQSVHDGEAAVRAAAQFEPQLVLLDIGMPKLNGYEACRQIRALPRGAAMTLVAVTGWGQPDDRRQSRDAGFDQHLVKPVDPELLAELIATLAAQGGVRTAS